MLKLKLEEPEETKESSLEPDWFVREVNERLKSKRNFVMVIHGQTGCLPLDTEIVTFLDNEPLNVPLRDLMCKDAHADILSYDLSKRIVEPDIATLIPSGKKEVFEVEFESGRTVRASGDHKFFVCNNHRIVEKTVLELNRGDKLLRGVDVSYDVVKSVRYVGVEETADLKVPMNRNFLLKEGLISHNSGKSSLALKICERFDKNFNISKVLFDPNDFFELIKTLPEDSWIVLDEAGAILDARRYMTSINIITCYVLETFRFKRINVIFTVPSLKMIDVHVRRLMHCMAFQIGRGHARVYKIGMGYNGSTHAKRIGTFINISLPSKELWEEYEKKKEQAFNSLLRHAMTAMGQSYVPMRGKDINDIPLLRESKNQGPTRNSDTRQDKMGANPKQRNEKGGW